MSINGAPVMAATVVAVDVGKNTAVLSVTTLTVSTALLLRCDLIG